MPTLSTLTSSGGLSGFGALVSTNASSAVAVASAVASPLIILGLAAATGVAAWKAVELKRLENPKHRKMHYQASSAVSRMA